MGVAFTRPFTTRASIKDVAVADGMAIRSVVANVIGGRGEIDRLVFKTRISVTRAALEPDDAP
jgi:hypothetical protein